MKGFNFQTIHVESYVGDYQQRKEDTYKGGNYCYECWQQFTKLTKEDKENLRKLHEMERKRKISLIFG